MAASGNVSTAPNQEISEFGEKVFCFCLQKFGIIYQDIAQSSLFTEDIGNAVVILQLHMRDILRDRLFRGLDKMIGMINLAQGFQTIRQLLDSPFERSVVDHSKPIIFLGYLALITELVIFLDSANFPVPKNWFTEIWTLIYEERLKEKFGGDWKKLKEEAKSLCDGCVDMEELFKELKVIEHPYAEINPIIEISSTEFDPFLMLYTLCTGFEFPRKLGLSRETVKRLLQDPEAKSIIDKERAM